jgi:NitT/TauT family transport system substrate-binding protein
MVKKDSPINSGSALNGKTVAVNVLRGASQISSEAWIDKHGGDSKTVQWIEMPFSAMQAALEAGRIDAAQVTQPFATTALTTCRSLGPPNDAISPRFLNGAYVASGSWIAAHTDVARKIKSALVSCAHWYNTDPAASVQAVATLTKQDPAVVAKSIRTLCGEEVTPALIQPVIDTGAKYGILKRSFPASEIIAPL